MSKFKKQDVVSIAEVRKLKAQKTKEQEFKTYLSSLNQNQLQLEADYLLNQINESEDANELILKSAMLMDELASRVSIESITNSINKFAQEVRSRLEHS